MGNATSTVSRLPATSTLYNQGNDLVHSLRTIDGQPLDLTTIAKGKVTLFVNVASQCGKTNGEYEVLTKLHRTYRDKGFQIIGMPSNSFHQERGTCSTIQAFVKKYNVEFPLTDKIEVNGSNEHPIIKYFKEAFPGRVTWNFSGKWIVNANGQVVARTSSGKYEELSELVEKTLKQDGMMQ